MQATKPKRKLYLDVLRILAAFLVCYNHSFAFELYLVQAPDGSLVSWLNVAVAVFATISMPLFFMLSGALLLGKEESYQDVLTKRVWRFLVLLFCGSGLTYLVLGERPLSVGVFVRQLLSGDVYLTFWFLYAYLSLLLAKPLLQKIAALMTGKDVVYLLILRLVFFSGKMLLDGCCSLMQLSAVTLSGEFRLPFTAIDILFYPLMGYYLSAKLPLEKIGRREVLGCFGVIILGTAVASALVYGEGYLQGFTQNYTTLFAWSSAMAVFVLVRRCMERFAAPEWLGKAIVGVSQVTIGIYLLEPIVIGRLRRLIPIEQGNPTTEAIRRPVPASRAT